MAEKFDDIYEGLMYDEDDDSLVTPYEFTPENQAKLAKIKERLFAKYPQPSVHDSSYDDFGKSLFGNCTTNQLESAIIVGQLNDEDCYFLCQTQRMLNVSQESPSFSQSQVSSDLLNVLLPLKQALASNSVDDIDLPQESLKVFTNASTTRLPFLCTVLETDTLSDVGLAALCRAATNLHQELSFGWCVAFVDCCLLNRVQGLNTSVPRAVHIAISCVAQRFPRAVVEGLMVPCWNNYENFNDPQRDLLTRLFKENLSTEYQNMFLQKVFATKGHWNENSIALLSIALDNKFHLDVGLLDLLTTRLTDSTSTLNNSLKFGKFLKEFILKFGAKFSQRHCDNLCKVIDENKTFLKKSCLSSIKKFCK